jgi:hypothetical protein
LAGTKETVDAENIVEGRRVVFGVGKDRVELPAVFVAQSQARSSCLHGFPPQLLVVGYSACQERQGQLLGPAVSSTFPT